MITLLSDNAYQAIMGIGTFIFFGFVVWILSKSSD